MRTLSTENLMEVGSRGVTTIAGMAVGGLEGVAGMAVGGLEGMAHGLEGAAHMAAQLGKPKVSTARKRQSEFNVFGDGDLVSMDFSTIDDLAYPKCAQADKKMTRKQEVPPFQAK